MMKIQLLLFFLLASVGLTFAQNDCGQGNAYAELNASNVRAGVLQSGSLWWNGSDGRYLAPNPEAGGSVVSAIFAGGLWTGGIANGQFNVSASMYGHGFENSGDYFPGPLNPADGSPYLGGCTLWDFHFIVNISGIEDHLADFANDGTVDTPDPSVFGWPGKDNPYFFEYRSFNLPVGQELAPFVDTDGDGIYDPAAGDYPDIKGDQMIWWVFNDAAGQHTQTTGNGIGLEIQVSAYAYASFEPAVDNTTFYDFKIIHRGFLPIEEFTTALWADVDLGCYTDDYIGIDTTREMAFYYNQDAEDGTTGTTCVGGVTTYGTEIPLLGIKLLSDSENTGITSFTYFSNPGQGAPPPTQTDPTSEGEYFNYLTGKWRDGTPYTVGGTGYNPDNDEVTNYAFPGNPSDFNQWSLCSAASDNSTEFDRRTVLSSGGTPLNPGDVRELSYAVIFVPDVEHPCPDITPLSEAADFIQNFDGTVSTDDLVNPANLQITLFPNPVQENVNVSIRSGEEKITEIIVTDVTGKTVYSTENFAGVRSTVSTHNLQSGVYFLRIKTDNGKTAVRKFVRS